MFSIAINCMNCQTLINRLPRLDNNANQRILQIDTRAGKPEQRLIMAVENVVLAMVVMLDHCRPIRYHYFDEVQLLMKKK